MPAPVLATEVVKAPATESVIDGVSVLLPVLVPVSVNVLLAFVVTRRLPILVKLSVSPVGPEASIALLAFTVKRRSMLAAADAEPLYCSVPPPRIRLEGAAFEEPIPLFVAPLARLLTLRTPPLM